jgi:hypothetical protein
LLLQSDVDGEEVEIAGIATHATFEGSQHKNDESMPETCGLKPVRDNWTPYRISDREFKQCRLWSSGAVLGLAISLGIQIAISCN